MTSNINYYDEIFLAPSVEMEEEAIDEARGFVNNLIVAIHNDRFARGPVNPHQSVALAFAYFALLGNTFDCFRKILTESLGSSSKASDYIIQLSSSINAYNSICSQMYLLYLNVWDITEGIFGDAELSKDVADASDKVVEQNVKDVRTWLDDACKKRGLPLQPIQLELDLDLGNPV